MLQLLNTYNKVSILLALMLNTNIRPEYLLLSPFASLATQRLTSAGNLAQASNKYIVKDHPCSICATKIICTPTNVPKCGEHTKPLLHFKGIPHFLLFSLLFPRSHLDWGWRCQLQMGSGWQHIHTSGSQRHAITYNSFPATFSTSLKYSHKSHLIYLLLKLCFKPGDCSRFVFSTWDMSQFFPQKLPEDEAVIFSVVDQSFTQTSLERACLRQEKSQAWLSGNN